MPRPTHRTRAVADLVTGAVPGRLLRRMAGVAAPLTRLSGATRVGGDVLASSLALLAKPPTRVLRTGSVGLDDIAERVGRSPEEVERWVARGLLPGPVEPAGRWDPLVLDRAALVDLALTRGMGDDVLAQAAREGTLVLLALEQGLTQGSLTARQTASRAGVSVEKAVAVWRALGFALDDPDAAVFGRREVQALRIMRALGEVFTEDDLLEATSVVGRSMSHVASALVELFRRRVSDPFLHAGAGNLDVMLRLSAMEELLVPSVLPLLEAAFRRHLEATIRGEVAMQMESLAAADPGQRVLAVAFADLVGFTSASESLTALEVATMATTLLRAAETAVSIHAGRIIKGIGDAVMFTTPDAITCARASIDLVAEVERAGLPPVRVGIAYGPVIPAYADLFGRTVNVASRLCGVAPPGGVLVDLGPAGPEPAAWEAAGLGLEPRRAEGLKGIDGALEVFAVRRMGG